MSYLIEQIKKGRCAFCHHKRKHHYQQGPSWIISWCSKCDMINEEHEFVPKVEQLPLEDLLDEMC